MKDEYKVIKQSTEFNGYFKIVKYWLKTTLFKGGWSNTFTREVFERGHAIGLVPYDKANNKILLIEQFRTGAISTPFSPWIIEPIAGIIEEGEQIEEVVRREAMEEAGIVFKEVKEIYRYLVSPGGTSESLALYVAPCDLSHYENNQVFGLKEEDEDIKVHVMSLEDAIKGLDNGRFNNAMAIIALQWLEKHWRWL
jgi:ADP-ribose pyrophosphatase